MRTLCITTWIIILSIILSTDADQTHKDHQWRYQDQIIQLLKEPTKNLTLTTPTLIAGVLCFMASAISSAGGIGGGGLFVPILTIISGLDLKTASSFSAFMVTGGSMANVLCNLWTSSDKMLIDFDIALSSEPCMLLGVSVGVICNVVFPEWLITICFAVFLAWSSFKTCKNGFGCWRLESEKRFQKSGSDEEFRGDGGGGEDGSCKEPLLGVEVKRNLGFPWLKFGVLVLVWFCFCFVYLLRGNRYGEGIITIEPCGLEYWILSSVQIPLTIIFTSLMLFGKENFQHQETNHQDVENVSGDAKQGGIIFPVMALSAGILGGIFGIGGGMLISPLLLHIGIAPEVTAATCAFMVFFSSSMSAFQYLLLGVEHIDIALIFTLVCFIASLLGLLVIQRLIKQYGRVSLIVFSVSVVMTLSTILMTSFGALDVWRNYQSGANMGFKSPC